MAKAKTKRGKKLGEVVGRRRPIAGGIFILIAVFLGIALLSYAPSQNIFFKPYLETFLPTTEIYGDNLCGKFGATFSLMGLVCLGAAAYMLPVYILWTGVLLLQRRANALTKLEIFCSLFGLLLFSILCAALQGGIGESGAQSAFWPIGWGGKFGTVIFDNLLNPFFQVFGSIAIILPIYIFCLIVVFVDSPIEAAKELAGVAKKSPSIFWRILTILWYVLAFFPRLIFRSRRDDEDSSDAELPLAPQGVKAQPPVEIEQPQNVEPQPEIVWQNPTSADKKAVNSIADEILSDDNGDELSGIMVRESPSVIVSSPISDYSSRFDDEDDNEVETGVNLEPEPVQDLTPEIAPEPEPTEIDLSDVKVETNQKARSSAKDFVVEEIKQEKYTAKPIEPKSRDGYVFPSIDLLDAPKEEPVSERENYVERMQEIVSKIADFGIKVNPKGASSGPVITRYEVEPAKGVRLSKIANLEDDIALGIRAEKVRIIAPIPGRGTVGIEVPNKKRKMVRLRDIIESREWNECKAEIPIALGKDITGVPIVLDLAKMPHALIAGSTNSGKSVCINSIILSLLYKTTPDDLRFIMVDPKVVEMQIYDTLPHMLIPVVTEAKKAPAALKWLTSEMMRRYEIFKESNVKNIAGFNAKILKDADAMATAAEADASMTAEERSALNDTEVDSDSAKIEVPKKKMPYIVCIIDELADLMMVAGKEVEGSLARLTQLARAAGIHLIVATQRPSRDVITGLIKSNLPTRIAFKVASHIDSRTILDHKGAETLIGSGDMLYINNGSSDMVRAQGAFLSDDEIARVVNALKVNGEPEYAEDVQQEIDRASEDGDDDEITEGEFKDPMFPQAVAVVKAAQKASTSFLQRKLGIGYGRAARIIDEMEDRGMIGPSIGAKGDREILM